jgi:hypothetical protein
VERHERLALTLFVPRIGADDTNDTFAAHDFAILAKLLNGRANFHILLTKSIDWAQQYGLLTNRTATSPVSLCPREQIG